MNVNRVKYEVLHFSLARLRNKDTICNQFHKNKLNNAKKSVVGSTVSEPKPVQTVALTADTTPSLDSVSLTVTLLGAPVNADSVMKIKPTCGTTAESEQDCSASPTCTVSPLSVAGCEYTMAVRMVCEVSGHDAVDSELVTFSTCTS